LLLPKAPTTLAALVLLDQLNGALSNALRSCIERLEDLAGVDNPRKVVEDVAAETQRLLESARFGLALTHPRHLVVVGKPNVGKSTLVNTLLAEDRVLVHHLPGTTRDAVATMVEISGVPFELVDTAGIREVPLSVTGTASGAEGATKQSHLEMLGIQQTWREVAGADIILLLLDASRPLDINDAHILSVLAGRNVIFVVTKCDLPPYFNLDVLRNAAKAPLCGICAPTGEGLDALCRTILSRVGLKPRDPGQAVPFTEAQAQALQQAADIFKECPAPESPRIGEAIGILRGLFAKQA
jgi:tRNA modification GTPase